MTTVREGKTRRDDRQGANSMTSNLSYYWKKCFGTYLWRIWAGRCLVVAIADRKELPSHGGDTGKDFPCATWLNVV